MSGRTDLPTRTDASASIAAVTSPPRRGAPKLLCSTVSLFGMPLDEAFLLTAEAGFDGVEVMVTKDPDTQDPERLLDLSERHDLPIEAIHAPFLLVTRTVWGADPVEKISRAVELARRVGAPLVVVHPPYRWQAAYRRWLDDGMPELGATSGVRVAVENMFPLRVRGRKLATFHARQTLEDLERYPDVVLDTSHAAVAGLDPFAAIDRLGDRMAHIHLSNNAGKGWDSHLPLDQGVIPIPALLEALGSRGFAGTISLELDLRAYRDDRGELIQALVRNRRLCGSRLSLGV